MAGFSLRYEDIDYQHGCVDGLEFLRSVVRMREGYVTTIELKAYDRVYELNADEEDFVLEQDRAKKEVIEDETNKGI